MNRFEEALSRGRLLADGAMGTRLQAMGLKGGEKPEKWNISRASDVEQVHREYLDAGCELLTANTFGASPLKYGSGWEQALESGLAIARRAVGQSGRDALVALDVGPCGRLLRPLGDADFDDVVENARQVAKRGADADVFLVETMTDLAEVKATVLGLREGGDKPIVVSMAFDERGRLLTGASIENACAMLEGLRVSAIGLNCGREPSALMDNLRRMLAATRLPVLFQPNASLPRVENGETLFDVTPERFAADMAQAARMGAAVLGGCCGTTPAHIAALHQALEREPFAPRELPPRVCVVSGRGDALRLVSPVIIGERINPTGKPKLKAALREGDMGYVQQEAIRQAEAGAHALDVNAGLPELDEKAVLTRVMESVQAVCDLPLQLDTADGQALESALRRYVGKPIINSVSGKRQSLDTVLPLAAKYGGAVVCLLLDEEGIPQTAEGRVAIARRILAAAREHGIDESELLFDALTLTVSTDENAARTTLETLRRLRDELRVKTVLGVSNVSFGLPMRGQLTAAFVAMAIESGLSAAILNPLDAPVRAAFLSGCALCGLDAGFDGYIAAYGGQQSAPAQPSDAPDCRAAIERGLSAQAGAGARALLDAGEAPLSVVEKAIIPALESVGEGFEKGRLFLPQLMQSAQAAQAAFDAVRERLPKQGGGEKRTVVLATVEGDVHDIGKNIVRVLLENYGFTVLDLGKDVPCAAVCDAVEQSGARLCGLSALMTTTVPAMARTIELLRKRCPSVRVMVGGAVLTQDYADQIGADFYGKDAMASVRYARSIYGEERQDGK